MANYIIRNGLVVDGSGNSAFHAEIIITGDKISYIDRYISDKENNSTINNDIIYPNGNYVVIDAKGKTVTPGFIDPHTHVEQSVLMEPNMEPYIKQGVTTVVTGNCGYCLAPQGDEAFYGSFMNLDFLSLMGADENDILPLIFDKEKAESALRSMYQIDLDWKSFEEFNNKCDDLSLGCNLAPLVGYSAVRTAVMGKDCLREATESELKKLVELTRGCMSSGAFGLSSGRDPIYIPGPYATDEEMEAILKVVADYNGIFTSHTYNSNKYGELDRMGGFEEMIRQGKNSGVRMNISHVSVSGMADSNEGANEVARKMVSYFEHLSESGVNLSYDVIPSATCADYTHKSFGFYLKPLVLLAGTRAKLAEDFKNPKFQKMVRDKVESGQMLQYFDDRTEYNWFCEMNVLSHKNSLYIGKDMLTCAEELEMRPLDAMMQMFSEDPDMIADLVEPAFDEAVSILCNNPMAMPCSDGSSFTKETNLTGNKEIPIYPNTMNISYIPRYLTKYTFGNFERAVHQASGFVAERFGIKDRGIIKEGNYADIVIMDREKLYSYDEDANPLQDPEGIDMVFLNGEIALDNGKIGSNLSGKVLRK